MSRIFKARYFPNKSYLTTTIGHNPSYVWRSILKARFDLLVEVKLVGVLVHVIVFLFLMNLKWLINGESIDSSIAGAHFVYNVFINHLMVPYAKKVFLFLPKQLAFQEYTL